MGTAVKLGPVLLGYAAAFLVAVGVTACYVASTEGPDRETYAAMYALCGTILFMLVLGAASLPATELALYFLRHNRLFWIALSVLAMASVASCAVYILAAH